VITLSPNRTGWGCSQSATIRPNLLSTCKVKKAGVKILDASRDSQQRGLLLFNSRTYLSHDFPTLIITGSQTLCKINPKQIRVFGGLGLSTNLAGPIRTKIQAGPQHQKCEPNHKLAHIFEKYEPDWTKMRTFGPGFTHWL
jgi:hypothetical protein